ncbi:hypothetical protein TWF718_009695 [Orbilia javanica]|uniref:Uncharacterized protein n=1 Tax=Orbilia javanica TaxID=47235 RepID=A0AAN8NQW6_9PEZI
MPLYDRTNRLNCYDYRILSYLEQRDDKPTEGGSARGSADGDHLTRSPEALYLWYLYLRAIDPYMRRLILNYSSPNSSFLDMMIYTPRSATQDSNDGSSELLWYSIGNVSKEGLDMFFHDLDKLAPIDRATTFQYFMEELHARLREQEADRQKARPVRKGTPLFAEPVMIPNELTHTPS